MRTTNGIATKDDLNLLLKNYLHSSMCSFWPSTEDLTKCPNRTEIANVSSTSGTKSYGIHVSGTYGADQLVKYESCTISESNNSYSLNIYCSNVSIGNSITINNLYEWTYTGNSYCIDKPIYFDFYSNGVYKFTEEGVLHLNIASDISFDYTNLRWEGCYFSLNTIWIDATLGIDSVKIASRQGIVAGASSGGTREINTTHHYGSLYWGSATLEIVDSEL